MLISQLRAAFPYYCLKFCFGSAVGFMIILLAELYKKDSEIYVTLDQLTWLASLAFLSPISTICTGFLMQRLGNRKIALLEATLYIASFLLFYYASNATMLFASHMFNRMASTNTLVVPYISEISEPQFRSRLLVISQMCACIGTFFSLLIGTRLYWRTIALVTLTFPILAALTVLSTPNSPSWLASKGRLKEAEEALYWLRGGVKSTDVQDEFHALINSIAKSKSEEKTTEDWKARSRYFFQVFLKRSFYLPLGTTLVILLFTELSGTGVVHNYMKIVMQKMDLPIEVSIASVVVEVMRVLGNFIILLSVHRTGKRKLALTSVAVIALCNASIAIVGFFGLKDEYCWVTLISLIIAQFAERVGIGTIAWMIVSEIYPSSVRYIGTSVTFSSFSIMMSLSNKSFLYIVNAITLHGIFLVYTLMNLVALVTFYFILPETEGRSLSEIEDQFKDAKCEVKYIGESDKVQTTA